MSTNKGFSFVKDHLPAVEKKHKIIQNQPHSMYIYCQLFNFAAHWDQFIWMQTKRERLSHSATVLERSGKFRFENLIQINMCVCV